MVTKYHLYSIIKYSNHIAGNLNDDLIKAAQDGDTEKIGNSLEKGADLNVRDDLNRTPLMIAATFGHSEVVQFLVDKGANHSDQSHFIEVATGSPFYGTEYEIWQDFGQVGNTEKNGGCKVGYF